MPTGKPPGLVDRFGQPLDLGKLRGEHSAPTVSGVRRIVSGHPAQGLTPERLTSLLREAENGSPMRYLELAEEMEEKDLHYLGVLGARKRAVAQLEITVEASSDAAPDQKAADLVREWLKRDELESDLFDILDAVGKGFSRTEIIWDLSSREWTPSRLEWRDPRWFTFDPIDGRTPLLVDGGASGNPYGEPLPAFKYICHDHKAKSGLPIRGGLARAAAWSYLFKNWLVKDWVSFAEIFGMPIRVGKYGPGETEENIRRLASAVADIGADAAAVIPQSMMMEFISGAQTGSVDLYERACEYFDKQVSKATLGQTATTDAETGGLGSGAEHGEVRKDIMLSDAKQLAATLNRDLVAPLAQMNVAGITKPPRLKIGVAEGWDSEKMMLAIEKFVGMGGRVGMSNIRDKLGIEDPGEDEELLQAPARPAVAQTPENLPQEAPPGGGGRQRPLPTAEGPLKPAKAALPATDEGKAAAAAADRAHEDALDGLSAASLTDWTDLAEEALAPIDELLASCSTLDEFRSRLAEAAGGPREQLTDRLARASFAARLAGIAGVELQEEEAGA